MVKKWFWLSLLLLLFSLPVQSEEWGLIVLPYNGTGDDGFNPLLCSQRSCSQEIYHLNELLFPRTLAIDPQTHTYTSGTFENNGLVRDWSYSDDLRTITLNLREDARWSDGTPVTAYDVVYTLHMTRSAYFDKDEGAIVAIVPLDVHTVQVTLREGSCNSLNLLDEFVAPVHIFAPEYQDQIAVFFNTTDPVGDQWQNWLAAPFSRSLRYPRIMQNYLVENQPIVTGGRYRIAGYDSVNGVHLEPTDQGALIELRRGYVDDARDFRADEHFTLFPNVAEAQHLPLEVEGAQLHSVMQSESVALWFNVANSANPQPAFDPETDERIKQEPNMLFADRNLRLAVAHLIDMDSIIEDVFYGEATPITSVLPSISWAANNDLTRYPYDFDRATQILDDAGWHLVNGRSPRLCIDCGTAPDETLLRITLVYPLQNLQVAQVANLIASELWRAGFSVDVYDMDYLTSQRFDLAILPVTNAYPDAPDNALAYTQEEDDPIEVGQNFTSYYNEALTDLLLKAETVPGCEVAVRRDVYQQAQAILHDEIIGLGLYTPHTVVAAQPALQNFNPQPGQMLWQVTEWVVWDD